MTGLGNRLLSEVAELSVPERMRRIAQEARRLAGTAELDALLDELFAAGRYERQIALTMATIAGARSRVLAQLDSPDPEFAGRALTAAIKLGVEPEVIGPRVPALPERARRRVYRGLAAGDRERLADALLPPMRAAFGDAAAARVLPHCSSAVVAAQLPELAYAVPNWAALGRRHIGVLFDFVEARAADAGRDEWIELWWWLTSNVTAAAEHDPDRLLAFAARAVAHRPVDALNRVVGTLTRHDAAAVYMLIRHPSGHGRGLSGTALWKSMLTLSDEQLRAFFELCPPHDRHRFLRLVPPHRRTHIAGPLLTRPGTAPGQADVLLLDMLPWRERATVARELLARPGGADNPEVAEVLTARLPWDEAKTVLSEAIRRPTADERARAYPLLVRAAAGTRDPAIVADMLGLLRRLRNEQDPVRREALHTVSRIPMSLLTVAHLPALEQLGVDALQARDCSYQTAGTVGELTRTLLMRGAQLDGAVGGPWADGTPDRTQTGGTAFADTALRLTAQLAEHKRGLNLYGLHRNLPRGAEQRLFAALRPRLEDDAARDEWELALSLAIGLDHRAYDLPELQRMLVRACAAHQDSTVRRAVGQALANPATRDRHLDEILRRDRSLVALYEVQALIARRRTDLLGLLWSRSTPGRFLSKKVRFVPMFHGGFTGWPPQHVDRYARLLQSYAQSSHASISERARAVRQLGSLPGSFDQLLPYLNSGEITVTEAALTALGRSDEPARAIAVLSGHVDDDHARVAVSAIACCARSISPSRISETIAPLLNSRKITSAKEGVRLLAALHAPDAVPVIHALWNRPDLHRDIRRAAVFATRFLLDHDEAWDLLAKAATDPDVAGAILDIHPQLLPEPQRYRFAAFVRELAAGADHRLAAQSLALLPRWRRWSSADTADFLIDRLTELTTTGLWQPALRTLLDTVGADGNPAPLVSAVTRLRVADATLPDRDLPARQRLSTLLAWLGPIVRNRDAARPVVAPVIELLAGDPLWHEQIIELTLAGVRWTEPENTVAAIESLAPYTGGALLDHPARRLVGRIGSEIGKTPAETLSPIAEGLAASRDPHTALTAVSLIALCGKQFGWAEPWPGLLGTLRAHSDLDVRRAAHSIYTAPE
ncbi:hypothetical protein H0264_32630 [Nocardia huaxiensis]|uniref:Uncharacterized protein n=1 Tax=Nocardia huaxiensis TaxID=2755382 RepID=A0A7D6Z149_9NOCA|nr:hypothetical protein [Nocardia huaxiensis]QLY29906.1 hypothetical protein H0264_32630 [Nocardia huaxiensis]